MFNEFAESIETEFYIAETSAPNYPPEIVPSTFLFLSKARTPPLSSLLQVDWANRGCEIYYSTGFSRHLHPGQNLKKQLGSV